MAYESLGGGPVAESLQTIILTSSILYELIGPASAKLSLHLSGSYSDKIEDLAPVDTIDKDGNPKKEVDILIERIQKIRKELPEPQRHEMTPEEQAFLEASEEQYEALHDLHKRRMNRRK